MVFRIIFSGCGTRSGIVESRVILFRLIFVCVVCVLQTKSIKTNDVLYFSACETCYGILCYIFPHVEHALVFFVLFFRVCNVR